MSGQTVWEAHKAVIRGELIAPGFLIKKEKLKEIADLLDKIHALETKPKAYFAPANTQQLETLQLGLRVWITRPKTSTCTLHTTYMNKGTNVAGCWPDH